MCHNQDGYIHFNGGFYLGESSKKELPKGKGKFFWPECDKYFIENI